MLHMFKIHRILIAYVDVSTGLARKSWLEVYQATERTSLDCWLSVTAPHHVHIDSGWGCPVF
jgi:hypothetical protein